MDGEILHLTDADDRFDRRVRDAVDKAGPQARLDIVDERVSGLDSVLSGFLLWFCWPVAFMANGWALARISRRRNLPSEWAFGGAKGLVRDWARAIGYFRRNRRRIRAARLVYANDQVCGLVALMARLVYRVPYVYDAHEMVPFRNRSYGLVRRSVEAFLEQRIARGAQVCHVVNRPVRRFYRRFYGADNIVVRNNDFFDVNEMAVAAGAQGCLLYVGAVGHRRLDDLKRAVAKLDCRVLLAVDRPGDVDIAGATTIGLADYEERVTKMLGGTSPYMWCHLEASVLSYKFALPNKFFQALSFGIPIVTARGTYLARIVSTYGVGAIIDPGAVDPDDLWNPELYEQRRRNVRDLRDRLSADRQLL